MTYLKSQNAPFDSFLSAFYCAFCYYAINKGLKQTLGTSETAVLARMSAAGQTACTQAAENTAHVFPVHFMQQVSPNKNINGLEGKEACSKNKKANLEKNLKLKTKTKQSIFLFCRSPVCFCIAMTCVFV